MIYLMPLFLLLTGCVHALNKASLPLGTDSHYLEIDGASMTMQDLDELLNDDIEIFSREICGGDFTTIQRQDIQGKTNIKLPGLRCNTRACLEQRFVAVSIRCADSRAVDEYAAGFQSFDLSDPKVLENFKDMVFGNGYSQSTGRSLWGGNIMLSQIVETLGMPKSWKRNEKNKSVLIYQNPRINLEAIVFPEGFDQRYFYGIAIDSSPESATAPLGGQ